MSTAVIDPLEAVIRESGEDWLFDWFTSNPAAMQYVRERLAKADDRSRELFGANAPRLTADELVEEYKHNPHKVRAFLQVLDPLSAEMLVMVWRILHGMNVAAIHLEYDANKMFSLRVRLSSPEHAEEIEEYSSCEIYDAAVLRHLGTIKMSGHPVFDGFYALNLSKP